MDTFDAQVCGRTFVEAGDAGMETGDTKVGGGPCAVEKLGTKESEEVW